MSGVSGPSPMSGVSSTLTLTIKTNPVDAVSYNVAKNLAVSAILNASGLHDAVKLQSVVSQALYSGVPGWSRNWSSFLAQFSL